MSARMKGVVVGLVTDVNDPDGLGRVKVSFPWLSDGNESGWARIATPLAGPELGQFFLPEVGDEALVAFELDDFRRPYVLGFLWNGDNAPPSSEPKERIIKTVSGHAITLSDVSGSESITIEDSSGKNKIVMDSQGITIESSGDVTIKGKQVSIEATAKLAAKGNPIHLNP